jgi:hypothetical protein
MFPAARVRTETHLKPCKKVTVLVLESNGSRVRITVLVSESKILVLESNGFDVRK